MKPIEVLSLGSHHPASGGPPLTFGPRELDEIASSYDPKLHRAPIVIGHPRTDDPAWGWIAAVRVEGGRLVAVPEAVDPTFADLVRAERYAKVSVRLYPPDAPSNPTPGRWHLRHVGFLGATPPAVKGLRPIEFGDAADCIDIELSEGAAPIRATGRGLEIVTRALRRVRDWLTETQGAEAADRIISAAELAAADQEARDAAGYHPLPAEDQAPGPAFAEAPITTAESQEERMTTTTTTPTPAPAGDREADLVRREQEIAAREAAQIQRERDAAEALRRQRIADDRMAVAQAVEAGRLPKSLQARAEAVFAELAGSDGSVEFSEGESTIKTTARQALRDLIASLPLPVHTGEIAAPDADGPSFAEASDPVAVAAMIEDLIATERARGRILSHADAVAQLRRRGGV
ncbi:hypothetical protein [Tistrella mobilis]|uniref:Peptidase n=1 Tax=Tistrella mobilis (strain KA081020-065) TaxID=1110502 RepID=I3TN79_TISMK|nr:hypothetical protein [Tistrella mobilis]AFK54217.1 hypothetical protein TMO_2379 [Tistrella mobilis KA081020-065]